MTDAQWEELAKCLAACSAEGCALSRCTEDAHYCEGFAYVREEGLIDVCLPDYFQGCAAPYAAVPLPWSGSGAELKAECEEQFDDMDPVE